jgi:LSD1 subclass zinc finger protein
MGTLRLKIKTELNYRRGSTHKYCSICDNYTSMHFKGIGEQPRCRIIGIKPGRMYRIHPHNICDSFDGSQGLKRLLGKE